MPYLKYLGAQSRWVKSTFKKISQLIRFYILKLILFYFISGFANESLYTGDIEYIDMPVQGSYWILPLTCMFSTSFFFLKKKLNLFLAITVQGNTINLPSGESSYAAIDTGTTLVGGPSEYIAQIFAQIPGSNPGTDVYQNYYTYRGFLFISLSPLPSVSYANPPELLACDTTVSVQMSFGGKYWTIDPADFRLQKITATTCLGAFFVMETGSSAPAWIVGDTFLVRSTPPPPLS